MELVGWLCFTSHQQQGHLETTPPFTVPCKGREAQFLHVPNGNGTPGCHMAVHYNTAAPHQLHKCVELPYTFVTVWR